MDIKGSVALVTGANGGLGRAFTQRLLDRGAAKVYAAARRPETIDLPDVTPVRLDITNPAQVAAAAELATDVNLIIITPAARAANAWQTATSTRSAPRSRRTCSAHCRSPAPSCRTWRATVAEPF